MRDIVPLRDRLVVRRIEEEEKTAGGLIIPEQHRERPQEAEVVAVGEGLVLENGTVRAPLLRVGDRVLFGKFGGHDTSIDGQEVTLLREDEVMAVLRERAGGGD